MLKSAPKLSARHGLVALIACIVLAACDDAGPADQPVGEDAGEESPVAQVLDGSLSDSMIEMDELRSQPPLGAGEEDGSQDGEAAEESAQ